MTAAIDERVVAEAERLVEELVVVRVVHRQKYESVRLAVVQPRQRMTVPPRTRGIGGGE